MFSPFRISKRLFRGIHQGRPQLPQDDTISCCYDSLLGMVTWPLQPQFEFKHSPWARQLFGIGLYCNVITDALKQFHCLHMKYDTLAMAWLCIWMSPNFIAHSEFDTNDLMSTQNDKKIVLKFGVSSGVF